MKELGDVDLFVAGAVGEPGDRTFVLQFVQGEDRLSYLLEKGQVEVLAQQSRELLDNIGLGGAGGELPESEPWFPDELLFRVGGMQLSYVQSTGVVSLVLIPTDDAAEPVVYTITPAQLDAAARDGLRAVESGRPKCPRCSLSMEPGGHHCPATNGDLRGYRP